MKMIPQGTVNRITTMLPQLNEKQQRQMLALEAKALGHGGITIVSEITGTSRKRIYAGIEDLKTVQIDDGRARKRGAGRKKVEDADTTLMDAIKKRVDPITMGDPESSLKWVSKSTRKISADLKKDGYNICHTVVGRILKKLEYSLQANKKTRDGTKKNPDRNAQFEYINEQSKQFIREGQPVLSVDTKKKELIGNFKNGGQEYAPKGQPKEVNMHDFPSDALLRAVPYGIYDIVKNEGWVSIGVSGDTAEFAVATIRKWLLGIGKASYPDIKKL